MMGTVRRPFQAKLIGSLLCGALQLMKQSLSLLLNSGYLQLQNGFSTNSKQCCP